jgi:predicted nucleic acid-binding protein
MLENRILPFGIDEAREAARLFNVTGRKRVLRVDAMIAASTIVADACSDIIITD